MTQRIEFLNMSQRIQPFFSNTTQRVAPFFFEYDAKSWTLFLSIRRKELNPFLWIWRKEMTTFFFHLTQRIEPFYQEVWLTELNCVSKKDSNNGALFKGLIELNLLWTSSQYDSKSWSLFQHDAKNWTFLVFQYDSKNCFFQNAQGIQPPFHMNYFFTWLELNSFLINTTQRVEFFHKKWLKALNTFLNLTERVELFLHWTQRIEIFFSTIWLKELSLFLYESTIEFALKKQQESPSQIMTQRIEPFRNMTHRTDFFETKKTHRIEPFFSLTEVNPSFHHDSQYWTLLFNMTRRMIFFWLTQKLKWISRTWLKELSPNFLKNDSKNWTLFKWLIELSLFYEPLLNKSWTFYLTQRIEPFFCIWLKKSNPFF